MFSQKVLKSPQDSKRIIAVVENAFSDMLGMERKAMNDIILPSA